MLEVVRLGVIGLRRGLNVVKEVAGEPGVVITAVCDRKPEAIANAVKRLEKYGVTDLKTYESFEELLTGPIDAVYIATAAAATRASASASSASSCTSRAWTTFATSSRTRVPSAAPSSRIQSAPNSD